MITIAIIITKIIINQKNNSLAESFKNAAKKNIKSEQNINIHSSTFKRFIEREGHSCLMNVCDKSDGNWVIYCIDCMGYGNIFKNQNELADGAVVSDEKFDDPVFFNHLGRDSNIIITNNQQH